MTIDIDDPVQSSQFLVKDPPIFYSAKIPYKHWQLRSLICSPAPGILYYPSNNSIYSINTTTRKRRLVATLPFSPRCIGARYGWVCAGGADRGQLATIRVTTTDHGNEAMSLDGSSSPETKFSVHAVKELGGYIVNSVTLHRPPSSSSDDDVLAILTNNDKTVRIFNLAESRVVTTLHVDVSTNHASISPDGKHLVVVGDSPEVYFYHPASTSRTRGGIGEGGCGSWVLASHPPISTNTKADTDALMSTSFSSSSLHCAVASQSGIITIFDTRYLACTDEKDGCSPIVRVITSSRPSTQSGAVRSVQFSPAPWDLLIWAEHCGRVCIADSRSNFTRRQVIDVLVEKDEVIEAEIEEVQEAPSAWEVSQSLLGNPTPAGASTHRYDDEDDFSSLSDTEQQAHINELAGLVLGDGPGEWIAARVRTLAPGAYFLPISHPELLTGSPAAMLRAASSGMPTSALLRDYRERYNERERARQRAHDPPRRRNSVHPSYTTDHLTASLSTPGPTSAAGGTTTTERERRMPRSNTLVMPPRQMEQFTGLLADQRRRQRRTGRLESETIPYAYYTGNGVDITGCTLAPDGRKLYVATDGGVVEYGIDVAARKVFPSISPR